MGQHDKFCCRIFFSITAAACFCTAAMAQGGGSDTLSWTVTNLHPAGATNSTATGCISGQQVGVVDFGNNVHRGAVWRGTPESALYVDSPNTGQADNSTLYATNGTYQGGSLDYQHARPFTWNSMTDSSVVLAQDQTADGAVYGMDELQQVGYTSGPPGRATLWQGTTASRIDLQPVFWYYQSRAYAVASGQQVGYGLYDSGDFAIRSHALLWHGSASTFIVLNPVGASNSCAYGVSDGVQAGSYTRNSRTHACVWYGTADTVIDINPPNALFSEAKAISHGYQAGNYMNYANEFHACTWNGSSDTAFDLHTILPDTYITSKALGIAYYDDTLYVCGYAVNGETNQKEAMLWRRLLFPRTGPADIGGANGQRGRDGVLDNNDFIVFIDYFFNQDPIADRGMAGGVLGSDGVFDNNDFIVFIDQFFGSF